MIMTNAEIGTFAWCESTGGRLCTREKMKLAQMLVRAQLKDSLWSLMHRLPALKHRLREASVERVVIPDSAAAREAEGRAAEGYPEPMLLHCYRTYYFASLFAQAKDAAFDVELLYVSSLLHDLGISDPGLKHARAGCFATHGARAVRDFAHEHGWAPSRAVRAYEAVSLHLNPLVTTGSGEAQLLAAGATMDVIGADRWRISRESVRAVHTSYPRDGFRDEILRVIAAPHAKNTRADFLRKLGFGRKAAKNPLDGETYSPSISAAHDSYEPATRDAAGRERVYATDQASSSNSGSSVNR